MKLSHVGGLLAVALAAVGCEGRPKTEASPPETSKHSGPALVVLDLTAGVPEADPESLLGVAKRRGSFDQLMQRIAEVADDHDAKGVFVRFGDVELGFARAEELGVALEALKENGKPVYCHANQLSNASLYATARACSKVYLAPAGEVEAVGLAAEIVYLHKLLADELHVNIDILQVGKYKGAEEPLTRDGPSDEARASLTGTLASIRDSWIAGIRGARGDAASAAVEDGPYAPLRAKALGLVDEVGYADEARDEARKATGAVRDEVRFGHGANAEADVEDLVRILGGSGSAPIALVRATGSISMGSSDESVLSSREGISERALAPVLARLENDDSVRAVVLRIDSPGGSALASDLLWHRLMKIRAKKPLVVSVGEMAASGGYYLASSGQVVFADHGSILGSMGVVGGKLAIGKALAQIGIHSEVFPAASQPTAAARAAYPSSFADWDDATRARVLESMTAVYDLFLSRVAEGRHSTVDAIAPFAEGRLFSGTQAHDHGLVDELGGLPAAIAKARELAKLPADAAVEAVGAHRGLLASLGGVSAAHVVGAVATEGSPLLTVADRLTPRLSLFAAGLLPLAEGESSVAAMPFGLVVR